MKEIKAYIRCEKAEEVIYALERAEVKGLTLIDVMAVGENIDMHKAKFSIDCVKKYQKVAKLEIICDKERVDHLVEVIRETAYTGMQGDGLICVADVERVVKIRTGAENQEAVIY